MTTFAMPSPAHPPIHLTAAERTESLPAETFRSAFRMHPSGVAVVTADLGARPVAITVSSLASVSAEPPLIVFSVSSGASSSSVLRRADSVVVHMVGSDQLWLAQLGATSGVDRFADTSTWTRLVTGEPVFTAAPVWVRGKVVSRIEAGEASIFVVHAVAAAVPEGAAEPVAAPLVYHSRSWHRLDDRSMLA
ncbi:flavin reductase family protein [Streptomyces sp. NPDC059467]|uniref:flavin reductase family protein n=1 Tax=Streptomyces sp. NPDC059467 TaxID=3346844 RepID=UPI003699C000